MELQAMLRQQHVRSPSSMSRSMPALPVVRGRLVDIGNSSRKVGAPVKSNSNIELRNAYLPLCAASKGLQQWYRLVEELAMLWDTIGFSDEQRHSETEAFVTVVARDVQQRIASCNQCIEELIAQCEAFCVKARGKLDELLGEIDEDHFTALAAELQEATAAQLRHRLSALQKVYAKIGKQLQHLKELRQALVDAARALGLDPSELLARAQGMSALAEELRRRRSQLCERRDKALQVLEEACQPLHHAEEDPEYVKMLSAQVKDLEARALALQSNAVKSAVRARVLWKELGEQPEPRDDHAVRLSADGKPDNIEATITRRIAEAVEASLSAWQDRYANAEAERRRLHKALHAFGIPEDVNAFLAAHGALDCSSLAACQKKLDEVMVEVLAEERKPKNHLKQLYHEFGLGSKSYQRFEESLDTAESREARRMMIAKEAERYQESLAPILGPLREIKALITAAVVFESNVQAGDMRFSGNSLHFLEEEKFRRRFARTYPELIEKLIEAVSGWEHREQNTFLYHGSAFREGLMNMRGREVALVRVPGDLSTIRSAVDLFHVAVPEPSRNQAQKQHRVQDHRSGRDGFQTPTNAHAHKRSRSQPHKRSSPGDANSPTHASARSRSSQPHKRNCLDDKDSPGAQARSPTSPLRPRQRRDIPEAPFSTPALVKGVSSPPSPSYPRGAQVADAIRIASGVRQSSSPVH